MEETYQKEKTIRGTRHFVRLVKRVKGMPGFAPDYYDKEAGEVVYKFPHGEGEPYYQCFEPPPILDEKDIQQILKLLQIPFDESKFSFRSVKEEDK